MRMIDLLPYLSSEEKAEEYLREVGILKTFTECPHCKSESIGRVRRSKYKCYRCKKEWSIKYGSFFENYYLNTIQILFLLKLFSYTADTNLLSREVGYS